MTALVAPGVTGPALEVDLDTTLPAVLVRRARQTPDALALRKKELGRWKPYTWSDYARRTSQLASGLEELGVGPGDRVAILAENRPAWVFFDLAVQALGAITVGIYPTSPAAELEYLLDHCGAKVLVAEDEEQVDKFLEVRDRLPGVDEGRGAGPSRRAHTGHRPPADGVRRTERARG